MSTAAAIAPSHALFDPSRLDRADTVVRTEPFCFLVAREQLPEGAASDLERDFPKYAGAGFFPYEERDCGPTVSQLVADLIDPAVATAVGKRLGIDNLGQYPTSRDALPELSTNVMARSTRTAVREDPRPPCSI